MVLPSLSALPDDARRVLVRVDYNVPVKDGKVKDTFRLEASLPTLKDLLGRGLTPILISHLGRPKGKPDPEKSLGPVAGALSALLGEKVLFVGGDPASPEVRSAVLAAGQGQVILLENLRFDPGEEGNSPELAGALATLGDAFVQDAFGVVHRAHASTVGIPRHLPSVAGLLVKEEVDALDELFEGTGRPFSVLVGGAKISDKLALLKRLGPQADRIFLGGALANTFLAARGLPIGRSLFDPGAIPSAMALMEATGNKIHLPPAVVVEGADGRIRETPVADVQEDETIFDIGLETVKRWAEPIASSARLFWNGPMGLFEREPFDRGTTGIAREVARVTGMTVVGGGDSLSALRQSGLEGAITHLSTGGGASLAYLEGQDLPGLAALGGVRGGMPR